VIAVAVVAMASVVAVAAVVRLFNCSIDGLVCTGFPLRRCPEDSGWREIPLRRCPEDSGWRETSSANLSVAFSC